MSDLQAAFDDVRDLCDGSEPDSLHVIVEAARKYANPDYEAAHAVLARYGFTVFGVEVDSSITRRVVDAALGVSEDE